MKGTARADGVDEHLVDEPSIGVGMGGSCPECHAPVELGQEFCLECGSPIRFRPGRGKQRRSAPARAATGTGPPPAPGKGFPWIPFAIVLLLVAGGLGFVLLGSDDAPRRSSNSPSATSDTEGDLPEITPTVPSEQPAETSTLRLQDCDPARPLDGSGSGGGQGTGASTSGGELPADTEVLPDIVTPGAGSSPIDTIPALGPDGTVESGDSEPARPSEASRDGAATLDPSDPEVVTVDQDGNLCSGVSSTEPAPGPAGDSGSRPGASGPTTNATDQPGGSATPAPAITRPATPAPSARADGAAGAWPSGKSGYTVVVAGFSKAANYTKRDAQQRAAQVQGERLDAGVLDSGEFVSLCPGFWVVFSGVYDTEKEADSHQQDVVSAGYDAAYVRSVRTTGTPADCGK